MVMNCNHVETRCSAVATCVQGRLLSVWLAVFVAWMAADPSRVFAADALHMRIDAAITTGNLGIPSRPASDTEFLRRVHLDLHGTVPTAEQVRVFLADTAPDKRAQVVDRLLAHPRFSRFMATTFDLMMMERQPDKHVKTPVWRTYLYESFLAEKKLDQLSREILSADGSDPKLRAAVRFYLDREGEPNRLTRDVGRIFFGMDLQCAQCHDHPLIDDYYQEDYYGIFAFLNRSFVFTAKDKKVFFAEKAEGNVAFTSVFTKESGESGPCLPEVMPIAEPTFKKGEEYQVKPAKDVRPIPKYSRRNQLAVLATSGENRAFNRNLANRLWAHMMGQGLVEPVDLYHSDNPPINPELMELLANELVQLKFNIRPFLRELALSQTYQRSLDMPANLTLTDEEAARQVTALKTEHGQRVAAVQKLAAAIGESRKVRLQEKETLAPIAKERGALTKPLEEIKKKAVAAAKAAADSKQQLLTKQGLFKAVAAAADSTEQAAKALPLEVDLQKAATTLRSRAKQLQVQVAAADKDYQAKHAADLALGKQLAEKEKSASDLDSRVKQSKEKIAQSTVQMRTQRLMYQRENQEVNLIVNRISDIQQLASYGSLVAVANQSRQAFEKADTEFKAVTGTVAKLSTTLASQQHALDKATQVNSDASQEMVRLQRRQLALNELTKALPEIVGNLKTAAIAIPKDQEVVQVRQRFEQRLEKLSQDRSEVTRLLSAADAMVKDSSRQMTDLQPQVAATKKQLAEITPRATETKQRFETTQAALRSAEEKRTAVYDKMLVAWERRFGVGALKPMTPEQMAWSIMQVLGVIEKQRVASGAELDKKSPLTDAAKKDPTKLAERERQLEAAVYAKLNGHVKSFVQLFGAGAGQPQGEFFATVDQALFMANGGLVRGWLTPSGGNLADRLNKQTDLSQFVEELYVTIFSRLPTEQETAQVTQYLNDRGKERPQAIQEMMWALVTSVEFRFNH